MCSALIEVLEKGPKCEGECSMVNGRVRKNYSYFLKILTESCEKGHPRGVFGFSRYIFSKMVCLMFQSSGDSRVRNHSSLLCKIVRAYTLTQIYHQKVKILYKIHISCQYNPYHPYSSARTAHKLENLIQNFFWSTLFLICHHFLKLKTILFSNSGFRYKYLHRNATFSRRRGFKRNSVFIGGTVYN